MSIHFFIWLVIEHVQEVQWTISIGSVYWVFVESLECVVSIQICLVIDDVKKFVSLYIYHFHDFIYVVVVGFYV